jgi:LPS sulfotransferase NodH
MFGRVLKNFSRGSLNPTGKVLNPMIQHRLRAEGISYLVCATQRSGSTLLCELLKGTEVAGVPDEFFESLRSTGMPRQPRQYFEAPEYADIAERLAPLDPGRAEEPGEFEGWFSYAVQRGTGVYGVFGAKMMWNGELPEAQGLNFNEALDAVFPNLNIIFVRRRDKVAQAVSLWRAIQTQQWRGAIEHESSLPEVSYDFKALDHLVHELHRWDASWEDWFHATGREPIRVIYEEFAETRAATVGRVLDALGIDPPEPEHDKGPMKRQSDDVSAEWVARYRADASDKQLAT